MKNKSNSIEECPALMGQKQTPNQRSKGKWTQFAMLAVVGLAAASLTGCVGRYTGGGSIDSVAGAPEKATFGFVIDAVNPDEAGYPTAIKGQFQFNDHGAGVSFHVNQFEQAQPPYAHILGGLSDPQAVIFAYTGTYTCNKGTGSLDLGVSSDTQVFSGTHNSDAVYVMVWSGPYAGYSNEGLVQNGNIQFKPAK
jgi:hypothetical protein